MIGFIIIAICSIVLAGCFFALCVCKMEQGPTPPQIINPDDLKD